MRFFTPNDTPPISFPAQIRNSYWKGQRFASEGAYWSIPIAALEIASAKRGEMIPTLASQAVSLSLQPVASGLVSAALTASMGFPPTAAAVAATVIIGIAASKVESKLVRGFSVLTNEGANSQRVRFGGNYIDTYSAQQRRQQAAIELAGALPTSRRWLGQEALFLHR